MQFQLKSSPTLLPLALPFAVLAIPLIDLFSAIFRRVRAGQSPFSSDKEHLHHRILRAGNTHLRTAFIMYLWTATIAFPVVVSAFAPMWAAAITAGAMLAFTIFYSRKVQALMSNQSSNEAQLLRGALVPTFIVGIISIGISTFVKGSSGFFGALLAQAIVLIYFLVHIFISKISRNLDPMSTMALAMFSYFAKFLLLGAFLWALTKYTSRSTIDRTSFGVSAIALTFAWLGGEIASYLKLKTHLPLPHDPRTN